MKSMSYITKNTSRFLSSSLALGLSLGLTLSPTTWARQSPVPITAPSAQAATHN